jgi:hypothetical protein
MVRGRDDVDVLVEVSTRTLNVARNAGVEVAGGDAVALLRYDLLVGSSWVDAIRAGLADAAAVTGPAATAGDSADGPERTDLVGRTVTYFDGGNVAVRADALSAMDGFDEYLETGGARDLAHRLAGAGYAVDWRADMRAGGAYGSDGGADDDDRRPYWRYRALAYRLVKNYGPRPTVVRRVAKHAVADGAAGARNVVGGSARLTRVVGAARDVVTGTVTGASDGLVARARDQSTTRNPHGVSTRADRAVACYDWR